MGLKRGAIAKARKGKPTRWDDFLYLVETLEALQARKDEASKGKLARIRTRIVLGLVFLGLARKDEASKGKLTDDQINILLEQERNLPTMDELQKELWKSEVEVASQA